MSYKEKLKPRLINGKWSIYGSVPHLGRVRKQYPTKDIADYESQKMINQVSNQLSQGQVRQTILSPKQEHDASIAFNIIKSSPKLYNKFTLIDLVKIAESRLAHVNEDMTLGEVGVRYINDLTSRERSEDYLKQVQNKINKMCSLWGENTKINDITKPMIRAWIRGNKGDLSPFTGKDVVSTTKTGELTFLKGYFNFARSQDWIKESPTENVKGYGRKKAEIQALSLEEATKFLYHAKEYSDEALCYFALSLFAGLRPEELRPSDGKAQLTWEDFTWRDEHNSTLEISYLVGKVTSRRVVLISKNLYHRIRPLAKKSGPVIESSYATWRGIKDYIRAKCGYKVYGLHFKHLDPDLAKVSNDTDRKIYVRDVLRHSAITYKLELVKNKDEVAMWAGNSPAVIDQHYRALVKGTDDLDPEAYAREYWEL